MNCKNCETALSLSENRGSEISPLCSTCYESLDIDKRVQLQPKWNPSYEQSFIRKIRNSFIKPSCDIPKEIQSYIEENMLFLLKKIGEDTFLSNKQITLDHMIFSELPADTNNLIKEIFRRVCRIVNIDSTAIRLRIFSNKEERQSSSNISMYENREESPAGTWEGSSYGGSRTVTLYSDNLTSVSKAAATIAHELGHEILLGGGILSGNEEDHEVITDLLTVFNGFGIFTFNSIHEFSGWQSGMQTGWSSSKLGYLNEPACAYALACYAVMRGELFPHWYSYLDTNGKNYFRKFYLFLLQKEDRKIYPLKTLKENNTENNKMDVKKLLNDILNKH